MPVDPFANCNFSLNDTSTCTLDTCCLAQSSFLYIPTYGGNLFFTIFFALFVLPQLGLGWWYKTWGFGIAMAAGLILEVIGYASRLMLHDNPFDGNAFLIYLITLTIAPVFISAAIYLCLTRMMVLQGAHLARVQPRWIAIGFMTSDFISLLLQAIGGAIADTADDHDTSQVGIDIMIAGLFLQALSLAAFIAVFADFSWACRRGVLDMDPEKQRIRNSALFKLFTASLLLAAVVVLIRSIFRVVELWQGFEGELWNNETDFMILDGAMIAIAVICLTGMHPGFAFGRGMWVAANWTFKTRKDGAGYEMKGAERGMDSRSGIVSTEENS
ncbi:phospholipid-translocating ATPase rsb1 [Saxophila tyrrhenica]|uniref:Phospholipid-translocating ATPase rsb1 n=1 Tax=Saxophila tyrrhenica TaxID=1690608 RepID=A0AAV9P9N9_9PEZI|nr:phospholipid-translocating ATPase rsb1 [Saxophila tyrrhenica]